MVFLEARRVESMAETPLCQTGDRMTASSKDPSPSELHSIGSSVSLAARCSLVGFTHWPGTLAFNRWTFEAAFRRLQTLPRSQTNTSKPNTQRRPRNMETRIPIRGKPGSLKKPCRFFAQGRCTNGSRCAYVHDEQPKAQATSTTSPLLPPTITSKVAIPCRFFALGTCNRGTDCIYSHEIDSVTPPPHTAHHSEGSGQRDQIPSDSRSQVQCSFFARGKCLKGDKCVFAHAENAETAGAEARTIEVRSHSSVHLLLFALVCDITRTDEL